MTCLLKGKKYFSIISLFLLCLLFLSAVLPVAAPAAPGDIITIAGGGVGDGVSATDAILSAWGLAVDSSGNIYIADSIHSRVRKIDSSTGAISTIAGTGSSGFGGDGGPATSAAISAQDIALDSSGNIYLADMFNHRIRKIAADSGIITTIAGTGSAGYSGDGGQAIAAQLNYPTGICVDGSGNIYFADEFNNRIRKIDASGRITTVAGNGVAGYAGDGGAATTARLNHPRDVVIDSPGNLYIADTDNNRIRKVSSGGTISTIAGNGIPGYSNDGGLATSASIYGPSSVALDAAGNLYIADNLNNRVRKVTTSGVIQKVAGTGIEASTGDNGPATAASLNRPVSIVIGSAGVLYIGEEFGNRVRQVDTGGIIITLAGNGSVGYYGDGGAALSAALRSPKGVYVDEFGNILISDNVNYRVRKVDTAETITTIAGDGTAIGLGDDGPATAAQLFAPNGITKDAAGNLYIADRMHHRIRKVDQNGVITTVCGTGQSGYSGDGGLATLAKLNSPEGVFLDVAGNLYIADTLNQRIRKVSTSGVISTVAGNGTQGIGVDGVNAIHTNLSNPSNIIVREDGTIYIADTNNNRIRVVNTAGIITTVAGSGEAGYSGDGGQATGAKLDAPEAIAFDSDGILYIADTMNHRVRRVSESGIITTFAGTGNAEFSGDNAAATSAGLNQPTSLHFDISGNLYIADSYNSRIRKVIRADQPSGTVIINSNATATNSLLVILGLTCHDGTGTTCAGMQFSNDGITWSDPEPYTTSKMWTLSSGDGLKIVYAKFKDNAGTWSYVYTDSIILDSSVPVVTITSPAASLTNNNIPVLAYTASEGTVIVKVDGVVVNKVSGNALDPLTDGSHTVRVEATDVASNPGFAEVTFTVDTVPPTVGISPVATPTNVNAQTITGTREADAVITASINTSATAGAVAYPTATTWSCVLSGLVEGVNNLTVTAKDAAGNSATATASITYDSIAPSVGINPLVTPTNVNTQTVTGTREADAVVTASVNTSATVGPVTYPSAITWSCVLSGLVEGANNITVTATDSAHNSATATASITYDSIVPSVSINPVVTPANVNTQTITGTREADTVITASVNTSATVGPVAYPTATTWSCLLSGLVEGVNNLTVTAADAAGNSATATGSITYDSVPPTLGINPVATPTNSNTQTITGTREADAVITASVNTSATVGAVTYPSATTWNCVLSGLVEGANNITVTATDTAYNSATATTGITYDSLPPTVGINPVATPTKMNSQIITGNRESDAAITVLVNTSASVGPVSYPTSATWSCTISDLAQGLNTITVIAKDAPGNSATASTGITYDSIAPTVAITSPAANPTNDNTPLLTYTVSEGTVVVKVDGVVVSKVSGDSLGTLSDGTHIVRVESTDVAANTGFAEVIFTVDTVSPIITINPVVTPTKLKSQTISGTMENGASVTVKANTSASVGPVSYPTSTTWSCTISGLVYGVNTITATAADATGNTADATASITEKTH